MRVEENELLCRVGPGTPMASMMRRYWQPVLLSADLPYPDCPPRRFRAFGEHYVAFRNTQGQVGVLDEGCCHRGASLALGRVEDGGIRCLLHGWKFAVDGTILDMPNAEDPELMARYRARAYPVCEAGDLIWVYLGPPDKQPPFRRFAYMDVPPAQRVIVRIEIACNYLHVMEGSLDSSHVGILHVDRERKQAQSGSVDTTQHLVQAFGLTAVPTLEVRETEFGLDYAAIRPRGPGSDDVVVRITPFIMPNGFMIPPGNFAVFAMPYDDTNTGWLLIYWDSDKPVDRAALLSRSGLATPGFYADDRFIATWQNNFQQDREAMANGSWSGLPGITVEDAVIQLSQGAMLDRSRENLVPADAAIVRARKLLLENVQRVSRGQDPIGLAPKNPMQIRSAEKQIARGASWHALVPGHLARIAQPQQMEPAR
jgi:phthalate 4,5-dioxygenase